MIKYHKILMSRFWEIVFCVSLLFRRHVCLSNQKHARSSELPLTARKTVFSHLNCLNTIPFVAAHTYIAHVWQYLPQDTNKKQDKRCVHKCTFITRFWWVWTIIICESKLRTKQVLFDSIIDHLLDNPAILTTICNL